MGGLRLDQRQSLLKGGKSGIPAIVAGKSAQSLLVRYISGLDPKIVNKTLDEAVACRRERIPITTFMVARDPYLINFVEELTKANQGRAYYSSLNNLGEFVFVDYIRNRKKKFTSR